MKKSIFILEYETAKNKQEKDNRSLLWLFFL